MGQLTFVLGGARSGKSRFAQELAQDAGGDRVLFVATAEAKDEEMRERVARHRAQRPAAWRTVEATQKVAGAIAAEAGDAAVVLVDCLSLLVATPLMVPGVDPYDPDLEAGIMEELELLVGLLTTRNLEMIAVSNEVGLGLVPDNKLGRAYRDVLGRANQTMAARADIVYLVVAGLPTRLK
jgi:adenosyl cobinamide kinase/adenosyl cobinamide phosphate guanylyltransferase